MDTLGFFSIFFDVFLDLCPSFSNQQSKGNLWLYSLIPSEPISTQKQLEVQIQIQKYSLDRNVTSAQYI